MDSLTASAAPTHGQNDSQNLRIIRDAFDVSAEQGFAAGLEALLEHAREDCGFRPYIASGHIITGHDAIRAFYRSAMTAGTEMRLRANGFRVYCPDQPGFGWSDTSRPEYIRRHAKDHVDFIKMFADALCIDRSRILTSSPFTSFSRSTPCGLPASRKLPAPSNT